MLLTFSKVEYGDLFVRSWGGSLMVVPIIALIMAATATFLLYVGYCV
jgi:hypothetical protein